MFVVGNVSNVLGMQNALRANGFLGVFTNQIMYGPNLVAPAVGSVVMTQTAPVESAATNPAMAQLVADVQKVAPGRADRPVGDRGLLVGRPLPGRGAEGGQAAHRRVAGEGGEHKFTYEVPDTVGPTTFPAAHSVPTPCGALVASNGTAYEVKVPYTCGRVVKVK